MVGDSTAGRAEILRRAFELMTAETEDIARLISRENGKVLADARGEVSYAIVFFRWFSEEAWSPVAPEGSGAYYPPTVLADVTADAEVLDHEIVGPVAPIVVVDSDEEAIRLANDTPYGLISYVYAGDLCRGLQVAEAMESGMVELNRGLVSDPAAPFGGYKQSGLGREGGFAGIHEFLETKYIAFNI